MEAADLRSRMVSQEHKTAALDQRMTTLEQWRAQSDIADARKEEQFKSLLEKVGIMDTSMNKKMDDLAGSIKWVGKLVIGSAAGAIIAGVVTFTLKGGFHIP
ncbi:pro-sigmaK processing inhibitor BofA family protein [Ensifer canadensis]|uniref:pro-sigmaK processing inhibitor BofA family protein n=1 Tax=Ensifer canadensis TaxID=555315 RepID=UPI0035E3C52F